MRELCRCPNPIRDTATSDRRLYCVECGGMTPSGRLPATDRMTLTIRLATDQLRAITGVYAWLDTLLYDRTNHGPQPGARPTGHSDQTGQLATDHRRDDIRAWGIIAARQIEHATQLIHAATDALQAAMQTAGSGGPQHRQHTYPPLVSKAELAATQAAQTRRHNRGETTP